MKKKRVAVVVPIYNPLNGLEQISFRHLNHFLKKYDKFFIAPKSLNSREIPTGFEIFRFPDYNFVSIRKYSELLTSKNFYSKFKQYEYILIYQLDALVFSDQLFEWCDKKYDYIGSPWFKNTLGKLCNKPGIPGNVGNGGFSLRKVESFLKVIALAEKQASSNTKSINKNKFIFLFSVLTGQSHKVWLKTIPKYYPFNEDGFWSHEAIKYFPDFKVAPFKEAIKFGFEKDPKKCFELNKNILPFGTHAWFRYDTGFWKPYLLKSL